MDEGEVASDTANAPRVAGVGLRLPEWREGIVRYGREHANELAVGTTAIDRQCLGRGRGNCGILVVGRKELWHCYAAYA